MTESNRPISRWEHLKPYIASIKTPFITIWGDPLGRVGTILFSLIILMAIFAPVLATHDPVVMNERIEGAALPFKEGQWQEVQIIGDVPLNDISISADGYSIAVGQKGIILEYLPGEQRWQEMEGPSTVHLHTVAVHTRNFAFAAGDAGTILFFDGNSWQEIDSPTSVEIHGLAIENEELALAVGEDGTVLIWRGEDWEILDSGVARDLNSVSLISPDFGVIVGDRGTILHFDGQELKEGSFRTFQDFTFRELINVDIHPDGTTGFAVGERGTIMGFDGESWFTMTSPESRELRGVSVLSPEEAYAVGRQGILLQYDGDQWSRMRLAYRRHFRGISLNADSGLGFAVGTDPYINELARPGWDHLFGTTHLGRDIFSQTMYGSRTALMVGIIAALVVNVLGFSVGLFAGYYRGRVDNILMRIVDIMYGFPLEPFAIILVMIFRPSLWVIIMAIGLLTWRTNARVIRSQVLSLAERPFIKAARVAGASDMRILAIHIAPNVLPLAFLQLAVAIGYAITAEATLSFLGLGPPQVFSWGTILHTARLSGAWRTAWWWVLPPGFFITVTVVSVFLISRSLEVLTNPRLRGGKRRAT